MSATSPTRRIQYATSPNRTACESECHSPAEITAARGIPLNPQIGNSLIRGQAFSINRCFENDADATLDEAVAKLIEKIQITPADSQEYWSLVDYAAKLLERGFGKLMQYYAEFEDPTHLFVDFFINLAAYLKAGKSLNPIKLEKAKREILEESACPRKSGKQVCTAWDYKSVQEFFTRELKPGIRPFPQNPKVATSPVDGKIAGQGQMPPQAEGMVNRIITVKGEAINFVKLGALKPDEIAAFAGGEYIDIYLAPYNYHRYHSPFPGKLTLTEIIEVGGREKSVAGDNRKVLERNVRIVAKFKDEQGKPFIIVFVSALGVSRINVFGHLFEPSVNPNATRTYGPQDFQKLFGRQNVTVERGEEIGTFLLGSTVVLLSPQGGLKFGDQASGQAIKLGEQIGH